MTEHVTCDEIVAELSEMLMLGADSPSIVRRTRNGGLTVLHELRDGERIVPYHYRLVAGVGTLAPGALQYEDCDIVIRTTPTALHRILSGELGGREAVASGLLDLRKAPSMPKLLILRALFNRYLKAHKRGEAGARAGGEAGIRTGGAGGTRAGGDSGGTRAAGEAGTRAGSALAAASPTTAVDDAALRA